MRGIGLDRVDNTERVYRLENLKPCCGTCNDIKSTFSLDQIKTQAARIVTVWPTTEKFDSFPRVKNPMREKGGSKPERQERTHWKASGIYYDILSDADEFYTENRVQIPESDYHALKTVVKTSSRAEALKKIKCLVETVNKLS